MVDVKTEHGRFNYADDLVAAGMVVVRALARRASSMPVVLSDDGRDITRLAVELAADRINKTGGRNGPAEPPAHLDLSLGRSGRKVSSRVMARRLAKRADWQTKQEQRELMRRTRWRDLETAARLYLEQEDDGQES